MITITLEVSPAEAINHWRYLNEDQKRVILREDPKAFFRRVDGESLDPFIDDIKALPADALADLSWFHRRMVPDDVIAARIRSAPELAKTLGHDRNGKAVVEAMIEVGEADSVPADARLRAAFSALRKAGISARLGVHLEDVSGDRTASITPGDMRDFRDEDRRRPADLHIHYGVTGLDHDEMVKLGTEIEAVMSRYGFETDWNGSPHSTVTVKVNF